MKLLQVILYFLHVTYGKSATWDILNFITVVYECYCLRHVTSVIVSFGCDVLLSVLCALCVIE